jgi:ubiquinone/menaquinone biosynthesis C-methylase UbiE
MLSYYDQRATEYDEAYTLGTGTASIRDPEVFKAEASLLSGVVRQIMYGRAMDLACGTAFWLPHYGPNCSGITLFDQSAQMLAQARATASRLGLLDRCVFQEGDFFDQAFDHAAYDSVLVGFFLSHLSEDQEAALFDALRTMVAPVGRFLILDSAWSLERARVNAKVERQERKLNDGTPFEIFKRYCDRGDFDRWAQDYSVRLRIEHFGQAFYAVSGTFMDINAS